MKAIPFMGWIRAGVLALSLVLLPAVTTTFAQAPTTPTVPEAVTPDDDGNEGLWGLVGLIGLAGLAGLRRRPEPVRTYNTETHTRR